MPFDHQKTGHFAIAEKMNAKVDLDLRNSKRLGQYVEFRSI